MFCKTPMCAKIPKSSFADKVQFQCLRGRVFLGVLIFGDLEKTLSTKINIQFSTKKSISDTKMYQFSAKTQKYNIKM